MYKILIAAAAILMVSVQAWALDLETARTHNAITEQPDGFIKANKPEAESLAKEINAKRKAAYEEIAKQNKIDVKLVGEQAAKKIADKIKDK